MVLEMFEVCSRWVVWLVVIPWLVVYAGCGSAGVIAPAASGLPTKPPVEIHWASWGQAAFEKAQREDKLILLDLTAVWCHACHIMDETTYKNPTIIELLNEQFIAIRVDTDRMPDVAARYRRGGWPTTSILLPSGEILFQANLLAPDELNEMLRQSQSAYRTDKDALQEEVAKFWSRMEHRGSLPSPGRVDVVLIEHAAAVMRQQFDDDYGGFREAPKFFEPDAIQLSFLLGHLRSDPMFTNMALKTLQHQRKLLDPVWGGFYRYATQRDWSHPHFEKMLDIQASNLLNYVEAYQITGDIRHLDVVRSVLRYVEQFLSNGDLGGFYASQDSDVLSSPIAQSSSVSGEEYYALNESERRMIGVPFVDREIFTGWNGLMALGFLKAHHVLGDFDLKDMALMTLNRIMTERYQDGFGLTHGDMSGHPREAHLFADQIPVARALLEAWMTTGDSMHLARAERLASDMVSAWHDDANGGFIDRIPLPTDVGLLKMSHKSLEENLWASIVFADLFYATHKAAYRAVAERTLQFVLRSTEPQPVALMALAADRLLHAPIHIAVVGSQSDQMSAQFIQEAHRLYLPRKMVRLLDPLKDSLAVGNITFPQTASPTAYVCSSSLCSRPVLDPSELPGHVTELLALLNER